MRGGTHEAHLYVSGPAGTRGRRAGAGRRAAGAGALAALTLVAALLAYGGYYRLRCHGLRGPDPACFSGRWRGEPEGLSPQARKELAALMSAAAPCPKPRYRPHRLVKGVYAVRCRGAAGRPPSDYLVSPGSGRVRRYGPWHWGL